MAVDDANGVTGNFAEDEGIGHRFAVSVISCGYTSPEE